MDLRERIVAACASGETAAAAAQRFGVCSRTVQRYVERSKRDALAPTPKPGRPPRLAREQEAEFVALVEESPNRTLLGLQEEWQKRSGKNAAGCFCLLRLCTTRSSAWEGASKKESHRERAL